LLPLEIVQPYRASFKEKKAEYAERARALLRARALGVFGLFLLEAGAVGLDDLERQQHVAERGAPGQQGRVLECHADDLERPRYLAPFDDHLPLARPPQPGA